MLGRILVDKNKADPRHAAGTDLLVADPPRWDGNKVDVTYWFWASLALFQFDGPSGPKWQAWNPALKKALVETQAASGDKAGSWEPVSRWSMEGGRVFVTAMNALTLEVYYRYANVFGGR